MSKGSASPQAPSCPATNLDAANPASTKPDLETVEQADPSSPPKALAASSLRQHKALDIRPPKLPTQALSKLIVEAVASSTKWLGISLQALMKSLITTGYDMAKKKSHFRRVLQGLVAKGVLRHLRGTSASGSFHLGKGVAALNKNAAPRKWGRSPRAGHRSRKLGRKEQKGSEGAAEGAKAEVCLPGQ